ncbi:MORN repeat-containing protein 4 homolog [Artemia franciscana]|uniref:MORN repeat-containing protein 4 n=1 Tax=Artemia franciscana TaxID=6661 RepID=A0AA88KXC9_ARTSF|nr:hypothetical protein QYM36_015919 [Artemia franciscana]
MSSGSVTYGSFKYEDSTLYIGEWDGRGQKSGLGHLQFANGTSYDGGFQNGLCSGLGIMKFPDGAKYEGEFSQGWFHGHGCFWRADGMRFEGEFRGGRIWGRGLVTFSDGSNGFPRNEGYFQDCRFMKRMNCGDTIQKAQKVAMTARALCDED